MALEAGNLGLFGLDLGRAWQALRQGWSDALGWPVFRWLRPQEPVRLVLPDGSMQWRAGASAQPIAPGGADSVRAVLLPDDLVLVRDLVFPDLLLTDLQQALALEASESSPFATDELVWGWRASERDDGHLDVRIALASRPHVEKYLDSIGIPASGNPEIWAGAETPVVIRGFGESIREYRCARQRAGILIAAALLVFMLLVLAATPLMLQRARVFDAQSRYAALAGEAAQAAADREALLKALVRAGAVRTQLQGQVDLPRLLDALTRVVPDTAHLIRLEVSGRQVRIGGYAENAASLIETLGAQKGFHDVRTPSAISRSAGGKESFSVEFTFNDAETPQ